MQYLTYDEYINIGGELEETAFNRYIMRACGIVDGETFNRVQGMAVVPDAVKYCVRDLVEYLSANNTTGEAVTSRSQTAGGVSESESYERKTTDEISADIGVIVYDYLLRVCDDNHMPLLYRGGIC